MSNQELPTMLPLDFFFYVLKRAMSFDYNYHASLMWAIHQTNIAFPPESARLAISQGEILLDSWIDLTGTYPTFGYKVENGDPGVWE